SVTQVVGLSDWTLFMKGGDANNGGGQPTAAGFLLNPVPIGGAPAFSRIIVSDGGSAVTVSGARRNDLTQRLYAYDLVSGSFASLVTQAEFATAAGLANPVATSTNSNLGRQYAFSGNGQAAYIADSTVASAFGGIYRADLAAGTVTRLLADADANTELAVLSAGGVDTILLRGGASTGNIGGIDRVTFNGSSATPRAVHLSAARLADFMETSGTAITTLSMAADAAGNVYFNNTTSSPDRRAVFRLDPQGRLSKVFSWAERKATLSGTQSPSANTLRMQPRSVQHPNGFAVTQLLYAEPSPLNVIAGAYAFKSGDFDRDNDLDAADLALFRAAITVRSGSALGPGGFKFDLNGNDRADWKDVQVLGQFLDYQADPALLGRVVPSLPITADADLNGVVDFADFRILRTSYGGTAKSFVQGDFTGDDQVTLADLQAWVNTSGFRSAVVGGGVTATPLDQAEWSAFLGGLVAPPLTLAVPSGRTTQFEAGYRSIVIASSVTKTGTGTLVLDGANSHSGITTVASGTLEIAHPAALATSLVKTGSGATVTLADGLATTVGGLDLTAGGRFDVGTGRVTVISGSAAGVSAAVAAGRGDGTWRGATGIVSSAVAAAVASSLPRAVGVLDNGDGSLTFAYAATGDTNLDGTVDSLDVANFFAAGRYDDAGGPAAAWIDGDFNYDGVLDILDATEFITTGLYDAGPYGTSTQAGSIAAVPEPMSGCLLAGACAALALLHARRRCHAARR
ncbi:MAG: autotransporter-associated beta strand repeat-containing protein, partial [Planctomycetaceae bacterium]